MRNAKKPAKALPKLLVVAGPTASGKTDLAIALAKKFDGEIISADSRQFYRGTDIGTDIVAGAWTKPSRGFGGRRVYVAQGVPHHLLGFLSPAKTFTAAQFKEHVITIARDIARRGHLPILCGGTGLYIRAVVDNFDLAEIPPDPAFRARQDRRSIEALYGELMKKDPAYHARIPANNRRYATRALEVMRATGKTVSEAQGKGEPLFDVLQLGIQRPKEVAEKRIEARVDDMMRRGLLEEAKALGKKYGWEAPALTGLGHRQLGQHLRGEFALPEAVQLIKTATKKYAKRQRTWLKRDSRIIWVSGFGAAEKRVKAYLRQDGKNATPSGK